MQTIQDKSYSNEWRQIKEGNYLNECRQFKIYSNLCRQFKIKAIQMNADISREEVFK